MIDFNIYMSSYEGMIKAMMLEDGVVFDFN